MDLSVYQPAILFVAVLAFSIGIMLLILGRFGKRIDNHPICKHCRFDLVGSIKHATRCPECGREVTTPQAIIHGHRKANRVMIIISLFILLASISAFTVEIIPMTRSMNWIRIQPTAWLMADVHGNNPVQQSASANELARRIKNNTLNQDTTRQLITLALKKQADRNSPWVVAWGNILDEAIANQTLTNEQQNSYLENAIAPILNLKYDTDEDGQTFLLLGFSTGPLHIGSSARFALAATITKITVDTQPLPVTTPPNPDEVVGQEAKLSIFNMSNPTLVMEKRKWSLKSGTHPVTTTIRFALIPIADPDAKPLAVITRQLQGTLLVHP